MDSERKYPICPAWPVNLFLTFILATLCYYGVERPLVRLDYRLTRRPPRLIEASTARP